MYVTALRTSWRCFKRSSALPKSVSIPGNECCIVQYPGEHVDNGTAGRPIQAGRDSSGAIGEDDLEQETAGVLVGVGDGQIPLELYLVLSHHRGLELCWVGWRHCKERPVHDKPSSILFVSQAAELGDLTALNLLNKMHRAFKELSSSSL